MVSVNKGYLTTASKTKLSYMFQQMSKDNFDMYVEDLVELNAQLEELSEFLMTKTLGGLRL